MPLVSDQLPENLERIHIMGIAGTAMASLAGMLKDSGYTVTGSDKAIYPPMSTYLERLEIPVMEGFKASNLNHNPDLVVVGNVIRAIYEEAEALQGSHLPYCSFPQLLGHLFLKESHSVVVAGTHGKTTTTSIAAWLLESAGLNPGFLIGGIAKNFERSARAGGEQFFVIEGDEYDTAFFDKNPKFLHYRPNTCILTSVEFDHADIYRDEAHVQESFRALVGIMPEHGCLITRWDDPGARAVVADAACDIWKYGPGEDWDGRIDSVDTSTGTMEFSVLHKGQALGTFTSSLVGEHNLYNQVAAAAAATRVGVSPEQLAAGFSTFQGIKRRQEVIGEPGHVTVIDDFAHHPTAVRLTLQALRQKYGGRRLWAIWEPRSATSRRNVFQKEYALAFDTADQVIVAQPQNLAGIPEDERFSVQTLLRSLSDRGLNAETWPNSEEIAIRVASHAQPYDVVAILSNGGFDGLHQTLIRRLEERFGGSHAS